MRKIVLFGLVIGLVASLALPATAEARRFRSRSSSFSKSWSQPKTVKPRTALTTTKKKTVETKKIAPASNSNNKTVAPATPTASAPARGGFMSNMASSFMGTGIAMWFFGNNSPAAAATPAPVTKETDKPTIELQEQAIEAPQSVEELVKGTNMVN